MKHRRVPIKIVGKDKFGEAGAAIERSPIRKRRHALPTILHRERGHIHPVTGRDLAVGAALFVDLWIKVIACSQIPGLVSQRFAL